jgi:hypothetical protein
MSSGAVRLNGVLSANLVFEQIESSTISEIHREAIPSRDVEGARGKRCIARRQHAARNK